MALDARSPAQLRGAESNKDFSFLRIHGVIVGGLLIGGVYGSRLAYRPFGLLKPGKALSQMI